MGKASSAKKVSRAASVGGGPSAASRRWVFPVAMFALVLLGVLVVFVARSNRTVASEAPLQNRDHWHAAYGFYVCDTFLSPLTDLKEDISGIHTHGDGVIHIHPFSAAASGDRARLKVWAEMVGVTFDNDGWTTPDGSRYDASFQCNGQPAVPEVWRWSVDDPNAPVEVFTSDFGNIRFNADRYAYTFAIVPPGTQVPPPPSVPELNQLTDLPNPNAAAGGAGGAGGATGLEGPTDENGNPIDLTQLQGGDVPVTDPVQSVPAESTPASTPDASTATP